MSSETPKKEPVAGASAEAAAEKTPQSTEVKVPANTESSSSKPSETETKANGEDDEDDLDDLDDLLDDFAEDVLNKPPGSARSQTADNRSQTNEDFANESSSKGATSANKPVNDEFKTKIEDLIKDLNIEDPDTKDQFEKLVKEFENDHKEDMDTATKNPQYFDDIMKQTMNRLKKSGETIDEQLKNDPSSGNPEDMLTQLLAGLGGPDGAGSGDGDFDMSKLLVDMLEQLSSKEVLYEPIKDLNTKFPDYLKEKKGVISEEEHQNYTKQYEITNDIVAMFESSDFNDEDKQKREQVNALLESLQELGQPPADLVGDASEFPGFGGLGGASGAGAGSGLDFNDKDLPQDIEKELEEGCKQT
ncbi:Pex19-domain-containing protein [Hyphopichia burtonii NRRL Y-1933]|uniref:Pex19-domain-containing protein n=1 Tax=Hyphopichia burtonii NRRL Y-1933 TaxID=984485 RepID=A0A1E4RCK7_9ASCO|nr:Pex19-domain-containing protein [Hyphopichia burtonii NRRL Y-1933]ODV64980.1 Pex19-domain-containing protein [Hyphopichia burtonii NRRL Y-1933]